MNYVAKGANLYEHGYRLHGSAHVIAGYLRTTWLWEQIRNQGGAYGMFSVFDQRSGVYSYLSYRDPHLSTTLDVYDRTGQFLRGLDLTEDERTRAIIAAIGAMDAHLLPDAKGYVSLQRYLTGETDAFRQQMREEILATTPADFKAFADVLDQVKTHGRVAVLGSEAVINQVNSQNGGMFEVVKVL